VLHVGNGQTLSVSFVPDDAAHYVSTSAAVPIDVLPAPLAVKTADASIVFGQPVPAFSVTYNGFVNGDTPASLGGTLAFTGPSSTNAGSYPITPGGLTSSDYAFDFQAGTLTIAQAPTTTGLSASPTTVAVLQPVKLTAAVGSSAPGAGVPAGTVTFFDGATPIGSASLAAGVATLMVNGLGSGPHALSARYDGAGNFASSTSGPVTVIVRPVSQSAFTLVFAPTAPTALGQPVSFAALVVALGGGPAPTGTVVFVDGSTLIGTATLSGGVATITTTSLAAGPHFIFAVYAGNASFGASVSSPAVHNVFSGAIPPTLTLTLSASPTPSTLGSPVTVSVALPPSSGTPTGTVVFLADNVVIGTAPVTDAGGLFRADLTTSGLAAGVHLLSAIYLGDGVFGASGAGPVVLQVQQPAGG
jgi:hypothetical protein